MRYNILSFQIMPLILTVVWLNEFFKCQDICEQRELEKLISENSSYLYSQHYMYLQSIRMNQYQPAVSISSNKHNRPFEVSPKLSFKYYSIQVKRFYILPFGAISIYGDDYVGYISAFKTPDISPQFEILNENELFAVRWFINQEVDGKQLTAKVTWLIHPNGKIVFYYDNISSEIKGIQWETKIVAFFSCKANLVASEITTPSIWIKSGTLMEYEAVKNYCPKHTSADACQRATKSDINCIWCDKANICIDDTDQDAHNTKVNNCHSKNPDVNDLSRQTPTKHIETASSAGEFPVIEHLKKTTEKTDQHSNPDVNDLSTQTPTKHIETASSAGEFPVIEHLKKTTEKTDQHSVNI
ncbi:unnamed protein product [Schistosoma margrebowiei]|uniref:Reelin domain-containing protein n=1 Tax=Schistosoma margrebowiei TaxID=48269 RepID=A0AA84ZDY2_9TREM|nr:unnamed protein product [Schistosoma margrebowiei]